MSEGIKETMDRLYGVDTIPRNKMSTAEMKRLISESKAQLRSEKGKSTVNKKTDGAEDTEKGRINNYSCPRCKEIRWMKLPDGTGRSYCLKCGEVIQSTDIEGAKNKADHKTTPASLSKVEKKVDPKDSINKPETDKSEERFCHPRIENAICTGCFYDMDCPRTFQRMVLCLLNNIDYKIKRFRRD